MIWDWVLCWEADIVSATATVVIAATSVLAALLGFFTYFSEVKKNRIEKADKDKRDRLLVKPFLTCVRDLKVDEGIRLVTLKLVNSGVGLAVIKKFILLDGDKIISSNNSVAGYLFLIEGLKPLVLEPKNTTVGLLTGGNFLQAGEEHIIWKFKYTPQSGAIEFSNRINFLIEYQSIYQDEVFTFDSREQRKINGE